MGIINFIFKIFLLFLFIIDDSEGFKYNEATEKYEFRFISESQEIQMGNAEFAAFIQKMGGEFKGNPEVNQYVRKIGQKLAAVSDRPHLPYEFVVVDNPALNACCFAGGKIMITTGLLRTLKSEAELAAVLAHEIGHASARHPVKKMERKNILETVGDAFVGLDLIALFEDRSTELEADRLSVKYLHLAGYHTQGAMMAYKNSHNFSKPSSWIKEMYNSHPSSEVRIEHLEKTLVNYPEQGEKGVQEYRKIMKTLT